MSSTTMPSGRNKEHSHPWVKKKGKKKRERAGNLVIERSTASGHDHACCLLSPMQGMRWGVHWWDLWIGGKKHRDVARLANREVRDYTTHSITLQGTAWMGWLTPHATGKADPVQVQNVHLQEQRQMNRDFDLEYSRNPLFCINWYHQEDAGEQNHKIKLRYLFMGYQCQSRFAPQSSALLCLFFFFDKMQTLFKNHTNGTSASHTTLAKKIETTARTWHRRVICRACTRLCLACVPVSIFLARVVVSLHLFSFDV